jgi:hypothetical protein
MSAARANELFILLGAGSYFAEEVRHFLTSRPSVQLLGVQIALVCYADSASYTRILVSTRIKIKVATIQVESLSRLIDKERQQVPGNPKSASSLIQSKVQLPKQQVVPQRGKPRGRAHQDQTINAVNTVKSASREQFSSISN